MSARRKAASTLPGLLLVSTGLLYAEGAEAPEMDFIEYLGMWEESDDEWLMFESEDAAAAADTDERIDPAPRGEASTEKDDES